MAIPGQAVACAITLTLLPIPILYVYQLIRPGPIPILCGGISSLAALPTLAKVIMKGNNDKRLVTLLKYLSIFLFASTVDLVLSLSLDGHFKDLMSFYVAEGERYFETSYGIIICYWDGIAHYAMYWIMLKLCSDKQPIQHVVLYWCGSFVHSLIILLLGSVLGSYAIRLPILLNIPYIVVPILLAARKLDSSPDTREPQVATRLLKGASESRRSCLLLFADILFGGYFVAAIGVAGLRGLASLGSQREAATYYAAYIERYLFHHTGYPKMQMLIYLFHFVPYYMAALYGLIAAKSNPWMVDWSLIHAGAAMQAQLGHVLPQFHHKFDAPELFAYSSDFDRTAYWAINLSLFIVPQLFALRCVRRPETFGIADHKKVKTG